MFGHFAWLSSCLYLKYTPDKEVLKQTLKIRRIGHATAAHYLL